MPYLTNPDQIIAYINKISQSKTLWLDTEVADWWSQDKELSLIQVLDDPEDRTGKNAYVLDVYNRRNLVAFFVNQIMKNTKIEKVFHNASFDIKYLGGKTLVKNVTCTYAMARKNKNLLSHCPDLKLKTLAIVLCNFNATDIYNSNEQTSDWGRRPLTAKQLWYAQMDVVYLAQVHQRLQAICKAKATPSIGRLVVKSSPTQSTVAPKHKPLAEMIISAPEKAGIEWLVRFGLPGQIFNCLNQGQIKTIAELQMRSDSQLLNSKGFERSYLNHVKLALKAYDRAWQKQETLSKVAPQPATLAAKIIPAPVVGKQDDRGKKEVQLSCQDVPLRSSVGVDYFLLRNLLAAGEWQLADEETMLVMLKAAQREEENWLNVEAIDKFPCADLRTINQLWMKYSNGHFGFSVQKHIYHSLGGFKEYYINEDIWEAFGKKLGWRLRGGEGEWLSYDNLTFNLTAPRGQLPYLWWDGILNESGVIHLLSRKEL